MSGKFDCLNDAVRGTGADTDVSPGCFDRLMVETVHINARAYKLFELEQRSILMRWLTSPLDADCCVWLSVGCGIRERSCQIVPPQETFKICIPLQIARTGFREAKNALHETDLKRSTVMSVFPFPFCGSSPNKEG